MIISMINSKIWGFENTFVLGFFLIIFFFIASTNNVLSLCIFKTIWMIEINEIKK